MLGYLLASDWSVKQIDMPFSSSCDPLLAQVPQEVVLPEPVTQVAAGHHHTLFLTESGNVWACGRNSRGQLGLGSKAGSFATIPQRLEALTGMFKCIHKGVCLNEVFLVFCLAMHTLAASKQTEPNRNTQSCGLTSCFSPRHFNSRPRCLVSWTRGVPFCFCIPTYC